MGTDTMTCMKFFTKEKHDFTSHEEMPCHTTEGDFAHIQKKYAKLKVVFAFDDK